MPYNSSPQTFIFKNIFPFVMLGGGIIGFFTLKSSGDDLMSNFANAFGIALIWISFFLIQMAFKLKNVEVNENRLEIKSGNDRKLIPFKNIKSVSKFDLSNPWMISVKYLDSNKNDYRKVSYMPNSKYQKFMKEDEMTEHLIQKAKSDNLNFEESNTLKNLLVLFLAGLPFFIGIIYFISKVDFNSF